MGRFDDQTVIITGGSRGMGASHARGFVAEGAKVVIADVLEREGRELADELDDRGVFVRLDVTSAPEWGNAVEAAEDSFNPVSVLVNNAGISPYGSLEETDPGTWREVIDVNLTGQFLGIHAVAPSMRKAGGGAIVNVSSALGMTGLAGFGAYAASKWGVRGLTKVAALELGRDRIRVNSIHPGVVRTHMCMSPETGALAAVDGFVIPRVAEPEEITRLVLFIASDEGAFSTGAEFIADGGSLLGPAPRVQLAEAA